MWLDLANGAWDRSHPLDGRRTVLERNAQHHGGSGGDVGRGANLGQQRLQFARVGHPHLEDVVLVASDAVGGFNGGQGRELVGDVVRVGGVDRARPRRTR